MSISNKQLDDFISRWEKVHGERLPRGEALTRAVQLLDLYRLISQPAPSPGDARHRDTPDSMPAGTNPAS